MRSRKMLSNLFKPVVTEAYKDFEEYVTEPFVYVIYDEEVITKLSKKTRVTEVDGVYTYTISYEEELPKKYETYNKIFNGSDIVITKKNYKPKIYIKIPVEINFELNGKQETIDTEYYVRIKTTKSKNLNYIIHPNKIFNQEFYNLFPPSSIESFTFTYDEIFVYNVKLSTSKQLNTYVNHKMVDPITVPLEYELSDNKVIDKKLEFQEDWLKQIQLKPYDIDIKANVTRHGLYIETDTDLTYFNQNVVEIVEDYAAYTGINNVKEFLRQYPKAHPEHIEYKPKHYEENLEHKDDEYKTLYDKFKNWNIKEGSLDGEVKTD